MKADEKKAFLRCIEADCEERYAIDERIYTCRRCGGLLDVQYAFNLANTPDEMKVGVPRAEDITKQTRLQWRLAIP